MRSTIQELNTRRENILTLLGKADGNQMMVNDLSDHFAVSGMTIRRDLQVLDALGLITRFHGGAELKVKEQDSDGKETFNRGLNDAISEKAAEFITQYSTIFVNSSTTALNTLRHVSNRVVNVFTNNINIANIPRHAASNIVVTGGELRANRPNALVGERAVNAIQAVKSNLTIIGCSGLSVSQGISTNNMHEAILNQKYLQNSQGTVILVANHSKINQNTSFIVSSLKDIDYFITDRYAKTDEVHAIEDLGVKVIQV